ncbi:MAG: hypothetical protein JRN67_08490 [Nitrososphaerota archaeon]|nr:hypothetical protein [Nitrososphaerota archaeon]
MRSSAKVAIACIVIVVVLAIFFLAPVLFWFNSGPVIAGQTAKVPVYRSLGCATIGYGDLWAPNWFGFHLGCTIPVPIPV